MKNFASTSLCLGLLFGISVSAQEVQHFAFNLGGGFTQTVGNTGRHLDTGWNAGVGAGYNFSNYAGFLLEGTFNQFGINSSTVTNLGFPDGNVSLASFTVDPIVHLNPKGPVDFYFIGGGGLYHYNQEFTAPTVATVAGFDPFFGFFRYGIPANQVLASYSVNKPGANIGAGFTFGTKWHAKFYAEARYHHMFLGDHHLDIVPVTFGVRF